MPNDLEIIAKIEKQINRELQPLAELQWNSVGYIIKANSIIGLSLYEYSVKDISLLKDLTNLTQLNLSGNGLTDISALKNLKNLTQLHLWNNQLTDISALKNLTNLTHLDLSHSQITDISALKGLTNLTQLNLGGNRLTNISALKGLTNLTQLNLGSNQLTDISALKGLTNLMQLDLWDNKITDISALKDLTNLTQLDLSGNRITDISTLCSLKNLTRLDLLKNQIKHLPPQVLDLNMKILQRKEHYVEGINLYGNPLESPPFEIVKQSEDAVRNYFESIKAKETERLYEAKLLIVGQGDVGKTFLKNRLILDNVPQTATTPGIGIHPWIIDITVAKDFRINFWDFGGQEIYHATHQFFLTKRSLYLFVWVARADDDLTSFDYWLNVIKLLSDNSPVIVVMNKSDERIKSINEQDIAKKFPNVVGFHKVSALKGTGSAELRDQIKKEIAQLPLIGEILPKVWGDIRSKLENLDRNFITYKEYVEICRRFNLDEKQADFLSRYFHDLGTFLHFADNPLLQQIVFLKPEWATNAVYKVLDTRHVQENHGRFRLDDLKKIWKDYPPDKFAHLLEMMKKFEICFELQRQQEYIVPELLRPEKPPFNWDYTGNLRFEYQYDFMPAGIITRFIVRTHHIHKPGFYWKDGVVLEREDAQALVISERLNRKITLWIKGDDKKELLAIIRCEMDYIHQTLNQPDVKQMLPCICPQCRQNTIDPYFHNFLDIKNALQKGVRQIQCLKSFDFIPIDDLLGEYGIEEPEDNSGPERPNEKFSIDFKPHIEVNPEIIVSPKIIQEFPVKSPSQKKPRIWKTIVRIGVVLGIITAAITIANSKLAHKIFSSFKPETKIENKQSPPAGQVPAPALPADTNTSHPADPNR